MGEGNGGFRWGEVWESSIHAGKEGKMYAGWWEDGCVTFPFFHREDFVRVSHFIFSSGRFCKGVSLYFLVCGKRERFSMWS